MPGTGNVMISTPHSVEQTRDGQIKFGEYETGVLAMLLHNKLNCPVICKTFNNNDELIFNEIEDVVGCRMIYDKTDIDIIKEFCEEIRNNLTNS